MTWKPFLAVLMLFSVAVQSLNRVVIVGGYYASAYTKNCENRAKPQLKCGGRCQMMKKLRAEDKKDQQAPASTRFEQVLSSKSFFASVVPPASIIIEHHTYYSVSPIPVFILAYLHPPGDRLSILS